MRYVVLISVFLFTIVGGASAQTEERLISGNDTIAYTYTPLPAAAADSLAAIRPDSTAEPRGSIFKRLIRYFEQANVDRTREKKIDFTWILGPSYSAVTQFSIGVLASGLYRIDRNDTITAPSNVSIYGNVSTSGFYMIGVSGLNIMDYGKHRISYDASFSSMPTDFWGMGYIMGRDSLRSSLVQKRYRIDAEYQYRILPNTYVGAVADFSHIAARKVKRPDYLLGQADRYTVTGIGVSLQYDSRDFIPNPFSGVYINLRETFFPSAFGSNRSFSRTTFTADWYRHVWRGGTIALDGYMEYNIGREIPWCQMAQLGGGYRMRGYYEGRYRDKAMIEVQAELRQRIYNRNGIALWVGAGNVFPDFGEFRWRRTLPNYGIGYRWEFKHRVNIRIDYGRGKHGGAINFNVNEAF